ncbi:aldolase catalytic domain-containing protein [Clostridium sp. AM58-1XD]|uniref:aldolase catalytic domain-containing protein n=1 Tax=Clostridium sp. AM58-1XD TaxID=2292307 RepID=UPI0015F76152|nr:aldolase catalytic domain-containing protein [Clostridium sp. AM58-1XD]
MGNIKLLDCTLRDGGYLVNKKFGDNTIKGMIHHLVEANVDIVEVGFLEKESGETGSTVFKNSDEIKKFLPKNNSKTMFVALADYSRYDVELLKPCDGKSIDGIRICFFKHERKEAINVCKKVKALGYKVFVQPVDILGYSDIEILDLIKEVNEVLPYTLSIVDTFGSMYLDDLERIFYLVHHNLRDDIAIGLHSHNNMQMSFALSQRFMELCRGKRESIIDATMCGMGRGAGNTNTELIAQYMNRKFNKNYDIDILLDIVDIYMKSLMVKCTWGYSIPYFLAGVFSAHVNNISYLTDKATIKMRDIRHVLDNVGAEKRKRYDYEFLEEKYREYMNSILKAPVRYDNMKRQSDMII